MYEGKRVRATLFALFGSLSQVTPMHDTTCHGQDDRLVFSYRHAVHYIKILGLIAFSPTSTVNEAIVLDLVAIIELG